MANWLSTVPSITNLYTDVIGFLKDRSVDCARWFSTAFTSPTNPVDGTVRWNATTKLWEIYSSGTSTWGLLAAKYGIAISGNADTATNATNATDSAKLGGSLPTAFATSTQGTKADNALPASQYTAADVKAKLLTVDGAGSTFDADLLDGEQGSYYAPKASPVLTGTPTAPTAAVGTNTTQLATTAFVEAIKNSTTLTGTPTAPTAAVGTNTTQLATTAFVQSSVGNLKGFQEFTSSGNFTVPVGVTNILVTGIARGGAGGAGGNFTNYSNDLGSAGGGGGGAGGTFVIDKPFTVTPGQVISISIGGVATNTLIGTLLTLSAGAVGSVGIGNVNLINKGGLGGTTSSGCSGANGNTSVAVSVYGVDPPTTGQTMGGNGGNGGSGLGAFGGGGGGGGGGSWTGTTGSGGRGSCGGLSGASGSGITGGAGGAGGPAYVLIKW